ncbi:10583_t:CDS:2, partial [Cetraspora pellucida]
QKELVNEGFKVIVYIENDFVQALGFLTPFNSLIQKVDINEIIIDSTYKTNNQKFELFLVIVNCGGYGVLLAYLEFFLRLRNEDILPIFILMDKDTGQIIAAQEAWSGKTKIQLCLWHIKRAISKKLKEKKSKSTQYIMQKAKEANELFDFIDISWVPKEDQNNLYSEENINEILNIVHKHSILHSLIPINKENFLTTADIYQCKDKDPEFFPQYATTTRRHDYPFIYFGKASTSINPANHPWIKINKNFLNELENLTDKYNCSIELDFDDRNELIESRKIELVEDKKMFESLLNIVTNNIQNDNFYNTYRKLRQTLVVETKAC